MIQSKNELLSLHLQTLEGRLLIGMVLQETGVFRSCMGDTDRWTAFLEGKRDVGLALLNELWPKNSELALKAIDQYNHWLEDLTKSRKVDQ